jgi:hypothetical protein
MSALPGARGVEQFCCWTGFAVIKAASDKDFAAGDGASALPRLAAGAFCKRNQ